MQLKNLGDLFGSFGELNLLKNKYGKNSTFDTLSSTLQQSFNESFKVGKNGISEFSTEQIKTKASVMGLNDALTKQALSLANDAGLYQKAAAGNLTFSKAIELNINNASDLVDAWMNSNSEVLKKYQDSDIVTKIVNSGEKGSAAYNEFVKDLIDKNQDLGDSIVELAPKVETTKSAFSGLSNYFKGLLATFTNPIFLLTTAVTVGVAAWQGYNQSVQESIQHTKDSIAEIEERNKSIDDNISKAQELRNSLDSGTLTEQEAYNAKSQLLDIQSQLSDSYGEQADGIDLVNGKLDEQIEKMQQLKVENAKSWLNDSDNEKNYEKAKKKMTKDDYESFFGNTPTLAMLGSEPQKSEYTNSDVYKDALKRYRNSKSQIEEIQKAAEQAGLKQYNGVATGQFQLGFENETVTGADEKLNNFLATVKELKRQFEDEGKNTDYFDNIISSAEDAESSYKDILDKHQEIYQEYLKNSMLAEGYGNNKPATVYQQYADAVDKYNEALQSGDTSKVKEAKTALDGVKDSVDNIVSTDSGKKYNTLKLEDKITELAEKRLEIIEKEYDAIVDINDKIKDVANSKISLNDALGVAIDNPDNYASMNKSIKAQEDTYNQLTKKLSDYQKEIDSQLSSGYLKKGSEAYQAAMKNIQDFTAKIYDASTSLLELRDKLDQIKIDTIQNVIDGIKRNSDITEKYISYLQSQNRDVPENLYTDRIDNNNAQVQQNLKQMEIYRKKQAVLDVNSKSYQDYAEKIQTLKENTLELITDNESLQDSIYELRFKPLDDAIQKYSDLEDELKSFRDLLNDDAFLDKQGRITEEGLAQVALLQQSIGTAKQKIADYTTGLQKLKESYDNGVISLTEYNDKSKDYREGIQGSIADVKSYQDSLVDLYKNAMSTEVDYLDKIISKRKEALTQQKDMYDYSKKINSQNNNINSLKAQIMALEGVKYLLL